MGTEIKITIDDIRSVAKAIATKEGDDWDNLTPDGLEAFMLRALNEMFTPEEQNQIIRGLSGA